MCLLIYGLDGLESSIFLKFFFLINIYFFKVLMPKSKQIKTFPSFFFYIMIFVKLCMSMVRPQNLSPKNITLHEL